MSEGKRSMHRKRRHTSKKKLKLKNIQLWQIASVILGLLLIISIITHGFSRGYDSGAVVKVTAQEAADRVIAYLDAKGTTATIISVREIGELYSLELVMEGRSYNSYVTKDGSFLFPSGLELAEVKESAASRTCS